jgi:hypothetical protein
VRWARSDQPYGSYASPVLKTLWRTHRVPDPGSAEDRGSR